MKLRSLLLLFVSLLLIAAAAMAAPAGVPAPTLSAPDLAAAAPAAPLCIKNSSKAKLPETLPAFLKASTLICGSCSVPVACRGVAYGSFCKSVGTKVYTCISALGNDCSDGTPQCLCWNGPLP